MVHNFTFRVQVPACFSRSASLPLITSDAMYCRAPAAAPRTAPARMRMNSSSWKTARQEEEESDDIRATMMVMRLAYLDARPPRIPEDSGSSGPPPAGAGPPKFCQCGRARRPRASAALLAPAPLPSCPSSSPLLQEKKKQSRNNKKMHQQKAQGATTSKTPLTFIHEVCSDP